MIRDKKSNQWTLAPKTHVKIASHMWLNIRHMRSDSLTKGSTVHPANGDWVGQTPQGAFRVSCGRTPLGAFHVSPSKEPSVCLADTPLWEPSVCPKYPSIYIELGEAHTMVQAIYIYIFLYENHNKI